MTEPFWVLWLAGIVVIVGIMLFIKGFLFLLIKISNKSQKLAILIFILVLSAVWATAAYIDQFLGVMK